MSRAHRTRTLWIATAACLGVALVSLLAIAWRTPAGAREAQVAQLEDPTCRGQREPTGPIVEDLMQQVIEQRERNGAVEGADFVVLNNRGYNYGPAPGVEFDALLGDVAAQSAARH